MVGALSPGGTFADLRVRIVSAVLMSTAALAPVIIGGFVATLFIAAVGALAGWEFRRVTRGAEGPAPRALFAAAIAIGAGIAHFVSLEAAFGWLAAASAGFVAADRGSVWALVGLATYGAAAPALVALRDLEGFGLAGVLWIAIVVAASDIGAYFAGRLIGGPKLWPRVSPKKTWAGLGGAMVLAMLAGAVFGWTIDSASIWLACLISAIAAVVGQGGDLAESAMKRRFAVKDSSHLIPGHGGVLDRLDAFTAVTLVAVALTFLRGAPVFEW